MATCISNNPAETQAAGERLAADLCPGEVVGITGDLGAGKTEFVKGMARALGVRRRVLSPSFALVSEYRDGRLPLYHLDLYRLETPEADRGAGLEEYLPSADGVTAVEWFEKWIGPRPPRLRLVWIEALDEGRRRISHDDAGA